MNTCCREGQNQLKGYVLAPRGYRQKWKTSLIVRPTIAFSLSVWHVASVWIFLKFGEAAGMTLWHSPDDLETFPRWVGPVFLSVL